jgi:ABC-2 type transport system ATP-binding protein
MNPNSRPETAPVIDISRLRCTFGGTVALDDVTLAVPPGGVFGLIGENGAGKTTLIKHITGLLEAESGSVRVFGLDPVADPVAVLSRVGYLSEHRHLPEWMRVRELLRYTQAFYPRWDMAYAEELRQRFSLDPGAVCKNLSQGQRAKAGLLIAQAHRPDLLLLDEPSSGLDPVVRRDILEAIVRIAADEGRTVFFSSHLLDEIERVSDRIAMMKRGKILLSGTVEEIKRAHVRLTVRFFQPQNNPPAVSGASVLSGSGREWVLLGETGNQTLEVAVEKVGGKIVERSEATLDDIFVARIGRPAAVAEEAVS